MFTPRSLKIKVHSRRVKLVKQALPIGAFLLASLMLAWPFFATQKGKFTLAKKPDHVLEGAGVNMQEVRFISLDSKNQPFTIFASSIVETNPKKQIITLTDPNGTLSLKSGEKISFNSTTGLMYQKKKRLHFPKEVHGLTSDGWKIKTSDVVYDYNTEEVRGSAPVNIRGSEGSLQAQGFLLHDKKSKLSFFGKSDGSVKTKDGTLYLTCDDGLQIDQRVQTITALQNVRVRQQDNTITADKMILHYLKGKKKTFDKIEKIEVFGHVKGFNGVQTITGKEGVYSPQTGKLEVVGDVRLQENKTYLTGEKITLDLKTGVSTLNAGQNTRGRVKGQLMPSDFSKGKGKK